MGRPYSLDLRERVVAAVEEGEMSARQGCTLRGWCQHGDPVGRSRETGSVFARARWAGTSRRRSRGEHMLWLLRPGAGTRLHIARANWPEPEFFTDD